MFWWKMNFRCYRYRHELAHDGQRIYILGGGTSWTSYPMDKVVWISTHRESVAPHSYWFIFIYFKSDPRVQSGDKFLGRDCHQTSPKNRFVSRCYHSVAQSVCIDPMVLTLTLFWQDFQLPADVTAVFKSKRVSRNSHFVKRHFWSTPHTVSPFRGVYMWGLQRRGDPIRPVEAEPADLPVD